jgi:hypothetical protein
MPRAAEPQAQVGLVGVIPGLGHGLDRPGEQLAQAHARAARPGGALREAACRIAAVWQCGSCHGCSSRSHDAPQDAPAELRGCEACAAAVGAAGGRPVPGTAQRAQGRAHEPGALGAAPRRTCQRRARRLLVAEERPPRRGRRGRALHRAGQRRARGSRLGGRAGGRAGLQVGCQVRRPGARRRLAA